MQLLKKIKSKSVPGIELRLIGLLIMVTIAPWYYIFDELFNDNIDETSMVFLLCIGLVVYLSGIWQKRRYDMQSKISKEVSNPAFVLMFISIFSVFASAMIHVFL